MNLLNLLQNQLSPSTVSQISNAVGESPEGTRSALNTAFPAVLGSLLGKANSSPSGLTDIFGLLKQGSWSDSIGSLLGGFTGGTGQTANQSLLNSLLGSKLGTVKEFIASRCGIRSSSASSILGMAAPMVMGALSKGATSSAGLGQLLGSQTQYLKDAMPAGLADTLGIGNLLSRTPDTAEAEAGAPAYREFDYGRSSPRQTVVTPARQPAAANFLKWAWVPLALIAAIWFFAARRDRMGGTSTDTYRTAPAADYSSPRLPAGSAADNLAKAISSKDWNRTIHLDGLSFDSAGTMSDAASGKLNEIGVVLANAPEVNVQITGYGETEEAGLSQANSVKNSLTKTGVSTDRMSTRGEVGTGMPSLKLNQP